MAINYSHKIAKITENTKKGNEADMLAKNRRAKILLDKTRQLIKYDTYKYRYFCIILIIGTISSFIFDIFLIHRFHMEVIYSKLLIVFPSTVLAYILTYKKHFKNRAQLIISLHMFSLAFAVLWISQFFLFDSNFSYLYFIPILFFMIIIVSGLKYRNAIILLSSIMLATIAELYLFGNMGHLQKSNIVMVVIAAYFMSIVGGFYFSYIKNKKCEYEQTIKELLDGQLENYSEHLHGILKKKNELEKEIIIWERTLNTIKSNNLKYQKIISNSNDVFFEISISGKIIYVSDSIDSFGYSPEELIYTEFSDNLYPSERDGFIGRIAERVHKRKHPDIDLHFRKKNGRYANVGFTCKGIFQNGQLLSFIASMRDISIRKNSTFVLRENHEILKAFFESSPEIFLTLDSDMNIIRANSSAAAMLGKLKSDIIGRRIQLIFTEIQAEDILNIKRAISKDKTYSIKISYQAYDRKVPVYLLLQAFPVNGIIGITAIDITDEANSQKRIREQLSAMNASIDGIAILDSDGKIEYANQAYVSMYGYSSSSELVGRNWKTFQQEGLINHFEKKVMPILSQKGKWRGESIGIKKDGSRFPLEISLAHISSKRMITIIRDISDRQNNQANLKKTRDFQKAALNSIKDPFFVKDHNHKWVFINDATCKSLGKTREELIGKDDYAIHDKKLAAEFVNSDNEILLSGEDKNTVLNVVRNGKEAYVSINKSLYIDENNGKRYIVGTMRDITDIKKKEYSMRFLYESSIKLASMGNFNDLYNYIAEQIQILIPNSIILINSYNRDKSCITVETIKAEKHLYKNALDLLGDTIIGNEYTIEDRKIHEIMKKQNILELEESIHEISFAQIPKTVSDRFEDLTDIKYKYLIGFTKDNDILGNAIILSKSQVEDYRILEIFLKQASVHLQKLHYEKDLFQSEKKYRHYIENAPLGVCAFDANGNFIEVNNKITEITGYNSNELIKIGLEDIIHEESKMKIDDVLISLNKKDTGQIDIAIKTGNRRGGLKKFINITSLKIDENNIMGFILDFTDKKLALDNIKESEANFRSLFDNASGYAIFQIKPGKLMPVVELASPSVCKIFDIKIMNLYHFEKWIENMYEDHIDEFLKACIGAFEKPHELDEIVRYDIPNQGERWLHFKGRGVLDSNNELKYLNGIILDITEQKNFEKALADKEKNYRLLAENVTDVIWTSDLQLNRNFITPSVQNMMGYTAREMLECEIGGLLTPESKKRFEKLYKEKVLDRLEKGKNLKPFSFKGEEIHKDGHFVKTETNLSFIFNKNQKEIAVVGITRDISQSLKYEKEAMINKKQLKTANTELKKANQKINEQREFINNNKKIEKIETLENVFSEIQDEIKEFVNHEEKNRIEQEKVIHFKKKLDKALLLLNKAKDNLQPEKKKAS